jgi:hypothetical protein
MFPRKLFSRKLALLGAPLLLGVPAACGADAPQQGCAADMGGITLPPGFCATVFADNLGHTRHMAVTADGTLYVNSWSGRYFRNAPPAPAGASSSR